MIPYDAIIVNGDSYSASHGVKHLVYSDYLKDELNVPVRNISAVGASNDRITRSTIEQVIEASKEFKNPLVIVGWSFIRRLEVWYYGYNPSVLNRRYDNLNFVTLDWLIQNGEATLEQKCLINEDLFVHKQLMDFYTQVYLLSQFLKNKNVSYFFFSAAKNCELPIHCFPDIEKLHQVQEVSNDQNIFKLHEFYIMDWALKHDPDCNKITGHMSENGHKKFSTFLVEKLKHDFQSHQTTQV